MYRDLPFNLKKDNSTKDIKTLTEESAVHNAVKHIICTKKGEIFYFPQFGCDLRAYQFEKLNVFTLLAIKDEIKFALENFEPRIDNIQVNVFENGDDEIQVYLQYRVKTYNLQSTQQFTVGIR